MAGIEKLYKHDIDATLSLGRPADQGRPSGRPPLKQTLRIVAVPLLISVAVTLLRLAGELSHWSVAWFSPATGGIVPSGWSWVVGITWLPALFGPYFAYRLWVAGHRPPNLILALGFALLGGAIFFFGWRAITSRISTAGAAAPFWLLAIWVVAVAAAGLQAFGWRKLAGTLLVYGLGSRAVVVIVMLLAMAFNWGTHYAFVEQPGLQQLPFVTRIVTLALIPQLVFWVGFTILLGCLAGAVTALFLAARGGTARA